MAPAPSHFLLLALLLLLTYAAHTRESPPPTPQRIIAPPPPDTDNDTSPPFRPGIAVVVCVLTTIISLTSLLLLYIKHCNGGAIHSGGSSIPWTVAPFSGRKNSGIDRTVVESLPVFRFGALRGQKEGLDCAVCLTKFEAAEVLRLLPKCKHAFHVECVDTWLDAHSTCPLCRYRVDPEDILLVEDTKPFRCQTQPQRNSQNNNTNQERARLNMDVEKQEIGRRHSSVGERGTEEQSRRWTTSFRRSLDSATSRKKNESVGVVGFGWFVRGRKDGMLLTQETEREGDRTSAERRLEHRIIVSPGPEPGPGKMKMKMNMNMNMNGVQQRWSDVQASDLLYLTSEMIMSEAQWNTRRGGRRRGTRRTNDDEVEDSWSGRGIINSRSVSEITGLSRFSSNGNNNNEEDTERQRDREWEQQGQGHGEREREEGLVRRWLGWISKSHTHSQTQPSLFLFLSFFNFVQQLNKVQLIKEARGWKGHDPAPVCMNGIRIRREIPSLFSYALPQLFLLTLHALTHTHLLFNYAFSFYILSSVNIKHISY
ncbi:RING-H2 finger protein ATL43 isoform X1 [Vigna angularis]|uniref:RING-H2 finger protein ATL43 isoform X1 n=1 Tax=Phaseolus angularis TaxID=3914 RepID=UPI0022B33E4E|nr:RING-H2 finger protein ATL43 isoform X1 [Vigna angularis]